MKMNMIALTSALALAACNETNSPPAQSPQQTTMTSSSTAATPSDPPSSSMTETPSSTTTSPSATMNTKSGERTGEMQTGTSGTAGASPPAPSPAPVAGTNPGGPTPAPAAGDPPKNADNTKNNERDRHGTLTPTDQGNSGNETKITAAIRRSLVADKTLSFNAKNVKVITTGTKVTLRGPVKSDQEKAAIEAMAKQTAGVTEVDNQLEIKK
jgi:hyperosmotically inducible periplasmic protein